MSDIKSEQKYQKLQQSVADQENLDFLNQYLKTEINSLIVEDAKNGHRLHLRTKKGEKLVVFIRK